MNHTRSADGNRIAYHQVGSGRPVIVVGGALSTAASGQPLAEAFAAAGLQGVCYDRRGRGDSGDTAPYAPEREVEDLRAVVDAVGGDAVVLGHSAGAVLAFLAAGTGVPMTHLFLSEPVLRFGDDEPPADFADRLQTLVDAGQQRSDHDPSRTAGRAGPGGRVRPARGGHARGGARCRARVSRPRGRPCRHRS